VRLLCALTGICARAQSGSWFHNVALRSSCGPRYPAPRFAERPPGIDTLATNEPGHLLRPPQIST
jgi:hypothetical protein